MRRSRARRDPFRANIAGLLAILVAMSSTTFVTFAHAESVLPFDASAITLDTGVGIGSTAVGDFDGDGFADLAHGRAGFVRVRFGGPVGHEFAPEVVVAPCPSDAVLESPGDLDGDGTDELAVSGGSIWRCLPGRTFLAVLTVTGAQSFAGGDFDDDGDRDVAVGLGTAIRIYRNEGAFVFSSFEHPGFPAFHACLELVTGDFNGDGQTDVARFTESTQLPRSFRALLFSGPDLATAVTLVQPVEFRMETLVAADLDLDGRTDLVAGRWWDEEYSSPPGGIELWRSTGSAFSQVAVLPVIGLPRAASVGDVDGDGVADIHSVHRGAASLSWYPGLGGGAFAAPIARATSGLDIDWLDVDRDGLIDPLISGPTGSALVAYRVSPSFETDAAVSPSGGAANDLVLADVNGDGRRDFVVGHSDVAALSLHLQQSSGSSWTRTEVPLAQPATDVVAADLDADGLVDFATTHASGPARLEIRWGEGGGSWSVPLAIAVPGGQTMLRARDLDADGRLDLVVVSPSSGVARPLLQVGSRSFTAGLDVPIGGSVADARVLDLTEDGRPDLVVSETAASRIVLHPGSGSGTFEAGVPLAIPANPDGLAAFDADGDGRFDLAVAAGAADRTFLLRSLGGGSFAAPSEITNLAQPRALDSGDFDGDGNKDLAVLAYSGPNMTVLGTVHFLRGHGDGTFESAGAFGTRAGPVSLAVGDITGDGRLDILVGHREDESVRVFENRMPGTVVGVEPRPVARGLALRARPQPSRGDLTVELSGRPGSTAEVEVIDLSGRRRGGPWTVTLGADGAARFRPNVALSPGVWFLRAVQDGVPHVTRAVVLD